MQFTKKYLKKIWHNPIIKKSIGIFLIVFGFIGLVTPFTPWAFLFFVGLEIMGIRFIFIERLRKKFAESNFFGKSNSKEN